MSRETHRGESNGAEDIDEFFFNAGQVSVHIERMANNEYFIGIDAGDKSATLFIGNWRNKQKLLLNIMENTGGEWHY